MEKQEQQEGRGVTPAKVIEGWVDPFNIFVEGPNKPEEIYCSFEPATLVIGEKAWPESKVRELMAERNRYKDALESIVEYWNKDRNDSAMHDACWHNVNTAAEALTL